jgi:predicted DNA-binding protein
MRSTKVIAFSVPPELERSILAHAKEEHRTLSEYLREAVRHYMTETEFESAVKSIRKKVKAKGLKVSDVEKLIDRLRSSDK